MPITGSTTLATVAAPAASSPSPYTIYSVTNPTGIFLAGFILQNTSNVPVTVSIFQNSYNNTIYSGTLAAGASATVSINSNLVLGEKILALANQGGVVNIEVDGLLSTMDVPSQYLMALMLMLNAEFGTDLPTQSMLNAAAMSLT